MTLISRLGRAFFRRAGSRFARNALNARRLRNRIIVRPRRSARRLAAAGEEGRFGTLRPLSAAARRIMRGFGASRNAASPSRRRPEAHSDPRILGFHIQDPIASKGLGSRNGSRPPYGRERNAGPATRRLSRDGGRRPGWSRPPPAFHDPRNAPLRRRERGGYRNIFRSRQEAASRRFGSRAEADAGASPSPARGRSNAHPPRPPASSSNARLLVACPASGPRPGWACPGPDAVGRRLWVGRGADGEGGTATEAVIHIRDQRRACKTSTFCKTSPNGTATNL
ncbi:hypothetical+protein [Methylocapsa aurea]